MSASEARPSVPRPKKGLLLAYKITRTCLASVHKYLRFCDLCKELAFGTPESLRPNQDFIQLVRAQHVLPPVPGERNLAIDGQLSQDFLLVSKVLIKQGRGVAKLLCHGPDGDCLPTGANSDGTRRSENFPPARHWANRATNLSRFHLGMSLFSWRDSPVRAAWSPLLDRDPSVVPCPETGRADYCPTRLARPKERALRRAHVRSH